MNSTSLFKRTEVIGRGKFGVVYKGYNKQTNQVVAIKVLNLDAQDEDVSDVQQEIQFLTELKNVPNVTHYYGSFLNDTKLWIIMDYCAGGSIRTLLKSGIFEERYVGVIMRELLIALQSVHKMGVIHRDLKAANVLITKEGNVQLCDFGVAAQITSNSLKRTTMAGTPYWMAPEVIREGDVYNHKADIWSLGITLFEITTGNPPYSEKDPVWAMQMISRGKPPRLEGREYSSVLKETIALCLDEHPDERPSADDLLKCKLVKLYKNTPTVVLKELVTRYLLWRDQNEKHRDSVAFLNIEDELQQRKKGENSNDEDIEEDANLQIKWDFDSLSSREYIIENDIDMDKVDENHNYSFIDDEKYGGGTYKEQSTINGSCTVRNNGNSNSNTNASNTTTNSNSITVGGTNGHTGNNNSNSNIHTQSNSQSTGIPKSLLSLFEDSEPLEEPDLQRPSIPGRSNTITDRVDSPTIEIPDMDSLANFSASKAQTNNVNSNHTMASSSSSIRPILNKPPILHHTQSASGNLESRQPLNRPRKKTISNTLGSTSSANSTSTTSTPTQAQYPPQQPLPVPPQTPPYSSNQNSKTPSPKPAPPNNIFSSWGNASSPSKSMKALNHNANPLLQPINFKPPSSVGLSNTIPSASQSDSNDSNTTSPNNLPDNSSSTTVSSNGITNAEVTANKKKRSRPGLRIQMPTPSIISNLNALTNDFEHSTSQLQSQSHIHSQHNSSVPSSTNTNEHQNSEVNQFGINRHQAHLAPMSMTPVTEKDQSLNNASENNDVSTTNNHSTAASSIVHSRDRTESVSNTALRSHPLPNKKSSAPGSNPTRSTSINASPTHMKSASKFPSIPAINSEFFMDSTPKQKLVSELDSMIKLFTQGLEALDDSI